MKAHQVTLLILDFDNLGADSVKSELENARYANRCISPDVKSIKTVDIGEWDDGHPLNLLDECEAEYLRLFPK